ncbi:MAG: hypothetical protein IPK31_16625 [Chitinophagaceae bacterium]|nr:hypothetical protein [Chitinophagaceae bacterium]
MNADLFSRLIQQPSLLKETSKAELEQLVYQYPWFGTAQFLLAAKLKQTADTSASQQTQKAGIFFNQPLWFTLQLKQFETQKETTSVLQTPPASFFTEERKQTDFELVPETEEEKMANDTDAVMDAEANIEVEISREEEISPVSDAVLDAEVMIEAEAIKEEQVSPVNDAVLDAEVMIEAETLKEEDISPVSDAVQDAEVLIEAETFKEEPSASINDTASNAPTLIAAEIKEETANTSSVPDDQPVFTFEPFHTVDYFASQGIKLREDKSGDDKLGQQVKTFTQWLRSMKKIYVEEKKELNPNEEKAVVSMATK